MADIKRTYLGQALSYPIKLNKGKGTLVNDTILLEQSIRIILRTPLGSRLFLPNFGSRLSELLFEPNDEVLLDLISLFIVEALDEWEKRIKTLKVECTIVSEEQIDCIITYRILNSNEVKSYVYPFYKKVA